LSKDKLNNTAWHIAVEANNFKLLDKLWEWAKEMQLKPEELRNELLLSKDNLNDTAWHMAEKRGKFKVLEKLWEWAKELQLKPEELNE
jgi:ankyrin repeat protein